MSNDRNLLELWSGKVPASVDGEEFRPRLELCLVKTDTPRGMVVVCPGGGYVTRAPHEGLPIAAKFNAAGIHACVVHYRVAPNRHPAPLLDVARAVRLVRAHAAEWQVDAERVAVCGFSAGGHLTASLGVHFDRVPPVNDPLDQVNCRPDALILCYPVISSGQFAHRGSFEALLGPNAPAEMLWMMSLELQVTERTPPTFLWHTAEDGGVPVENSLLFAQALSAHNVPFELHVYPQGRHGLGLAPEDPHVATWSDLCCEWLHGMGW